ncbi:hypothetical protein BGZ76_001675 [Entomortierella beljakovae]|nr:hypothetical protein BGZ76_001675 [Entomortierella beljakovae]
MFKRIRNAFTNSQSDGTNTQGKKPVTVQSQKPQGNGSAKQRMGPSIPQTPKPTTPTQQGTQSQKPQATKQGNTRSSSFQSLVERSIAAWKTIHWIGETEDKEMSNLGLGDSPKEMSIRLNAHALRSYQTVEALLEGRHFWFFHLRNDFMKQSRVPKWSANSLDRYILLPMNYGFVNKKDCFFISHCWRTKADPDPKGIDMAMFRDDLRNLDWSYVWIDLSCLPQSPKTDIEVQYVHKMKHSVPRLIQDCAFEWRYTPFEPRAWILFEMTVYLLSHKKNSNPLADDNKVFANHVYEMTKKGVQQTLQKYGYRSSDPNDMKLLTGWMELLVIIHNNVIELADRKLIVGHIYSSDVGSVSIYDTFVSLLKIDKNAGTFSLPGITHEFTPGFHHRN